MHETKGIVHLDLKLGNILLDENFNIKLVDFGLSTSNNINSLALKNGTPTYMAPEIHQRMSSCNGKKADIFALGVIIFSIVCGKSPFTKNSEQTDSNY